MALHAIKYSTNVHIESHRINLSNSFTDRYVISFDAISREVELLDTFVNTERCLQMEGFPDDLTTCLFYWVQDRTWHVMFTRQTVVFDKNIQQIQQFYGQAELIEDDKLILLNSREIELKRNDFVYNFHQLNNGSCRHWMWIQRRVVGASRTMEIYKCKVMQDERPEQILTLKLNYFGRNFHITMVNIIGKHCCYFLKNFGTLFLPEEETVFLEEFHTFHMDTGEHRIHKTQPFPALGDQLDNFSIDSRHLWHGHRLHLLFRHDIWGKICGNFMYKLVVFDANTLSWAKIELPIDDLLTQAKLVHLDSSAVLTFRLQDTQPNRYSFYRCPLRQPEKLSNLCWFKYKQLNNFCLPTIDWLPESLRAQLE